MIVNSFSFSMSLSPIWLLMFAGVSVDGGEHRAEHEEMVESRALLLLSLRSQLRVSVLLRIESMERELNVLLGDEILSSRALLSMLFSGDNVIELLILTIDINPSGVSSSVNG